MRPPPSSAPPPRPWAERAASLQALPRFILNGRLGASDGKQGFSAGIHWQESGADASIDLSGPLGFGAAHLQQQGGELQIVTANGAHLDGEAAEAQLARMLGFDPPLNSLRYWVLGVNDPQSSAHYTLDDRQRLASLQQGGWRVDYQDYSAVQRYWLPRQLTVTHQQLRLRLVINGWQL